MAVLESLLKRSVPAEPPYDTKTNFSQAHYCVSAWCSLRWCWYHLYNSGQDENGVRIASKRRQFSDDSVMRVFTRGSRNACLCCHWNDDARNRWLKE